MRGHEGFIIGGHHRAAALRLTRSGGNLEELEELKRRIKRLRLHGWTWRRIAEACGREPGSWAFLVVKALYVPPEKRVKEALKAMSQQRDLPREKWTTTPELEEAVLREIQTNHVGIKRAIKSRDLARRLGTTDRMVRACVNALRKRGIPICSSVGEQAGFYMATDEQELEEFIHRDYLSRANEINRVITALRAGAKNWFDGSPLPGEQLVLVEQRDGQPEMAL